MSAPPSEGARILVIKLAALGDVVQAFGPFAAIHAHHPDAEITLLTTPPYAGLLRRSDTTAGVLVQTISRVARGQGEVPPDLLGRLLEQVGRLQRQVLAPRGLTFTGLTPRETAVLRMVADGHDTSDIAVQLCYSERTVKNVLHDVTTRLQLRNRSHAVAYAVREGLI